MSRQNKLDTVDGADIVIVGNGIAGLTAAVEARKFAPDRRIVILTKQNHPTINTPALKQFAIGKLTREQLLAFPTGTERTQRIHIVNAQVEEIHSQEGYLSLAGGRCFGYGSLLIATGSSPMGLSPDLPGYDFDGVMTLHRLSDYLDLRRRLGEVEEAVVVGGGVHAIETVMGLLYWGIRVHWLIRSATFMSRMLDRPASDMVLEGVQRAGVKVYTETEVMGIVGRVGAVAGVVTNQRQMLPCQLVLVCTGTAPVTDLAKRCDTPMKAKNGILVDDQLRTSTRNIYAAGDVAAIRDPLTGKYAPRAQWYSAVLQARMVAASMTGADMPEEGFGVPWHATRLGDLSMLTVGNMEWRDTATNLTDGGKGSYRRVSVIDDRLVGYLSLGPTQPDSLAIKRIIDEGLSVRDIKKDLLKGEFDARRYFSNKRTYQAQRMMTTGKLPTPLPPVDGSILTGTSRALSAPQPSAPRMPVTNVNNPVYNTPPTRKLEEDSRLLPAASNRYEMSSGQRTPGETGPGRSQPLPQTGPLVETSGRRYVEARQPSTDPLVRPTTSRRTGEQNAPYAPQRSPGFDNQNNFLLDRPGPAEPRSPAAQRNQDTSGSDGHWSYSEPIIPGKDKERYDAAPAPQGPDTGDQLLKTPTERQFVPPPVVQAREAKKAGNPHPSRSLWHYTDKYAIVKGGR